MAKLELSHVNGSVSIGRHYQILVANATKMTKIKIVAFATKSTGGQI